MWNDFFSVPTDQNETNVENTDDANEVRLTFIEVSLGILLRFSFLHPCLLTLIGLQKILKSAYHHQIKNGILEEYGDLPYSLFQGLHFCENKCAKGHVLNDWEATKVASATKVVLANNIFPMLLLNMRQLWRRERRCCSDDSHWSRPAVLEVRFLIRLNLAFVGAHR